MATRKKAKTTPKSAKKALVKKPASKQKAPSSGKAKAVKKSALSKPAVRKKHAVKAPAQPAPAPKISGLAPAPPTPPTLEEIARRRFRVENPTRAPFGAKKLNQATMWDELIFAIVSAAGPRGITIENICREALEIKHSKSEIKEKNISPESNFHNAGISNIEAVRRYLDDNLYQTIYGYREITKK